MWNKSKFSYCLNTYSTCESSFIVRHQHRATTWWNVYMYMCMCVCVCMRLCVCVCSHVFFVMLPHTPSSHLPQSLTLAPGTSSIQHYCPSSSGRASQGWVPSQFYPPGSIYLLARVNPSLTKSQMGDPIWEEGRGGGIFLLTSGKKVSGKSKCDDGEFLNLPHEKNIYHHYKQDWFEDFTVVMHLQCHLLSSPVVRSFFYRLPKHLWST